MNNFTPNSPVKTNKTSAVDDTTTTPKKKVVKKVVRRVVKKRPDGTIVSSHLEPMEGEASTDSPKKPSTVTRRKSAHAASFTGTSTPSPAAPKTRVVRRKSAGMVGLASSKDNNNSSSTATPSTPDNKVTNKPAMPRVGSFKANSLVKSNSFKKRDNGEEKKDDNHASISSSTNNKSFSGSFSNLGGGGGGFMTPADFQAKAARRSSGGAGVRNNFTQAHNSSSSGLSYVPSSPTPTTKKGPAQIESPSAKSSFGKWGVTAKASSPVGSPKRPAVTRAGSSSSGLSWMNGSLANMNAVQLRRFKQPATDLQAAVRGFLARRYVVRLQKKRAERLAQEQAQEAERQRLEAERRANEEKSNAATVVQCGVRVMLAKRFVRRSKAATVIQAPARTWLVQRNMVVPRLEYKLRMLEVERQEELQTIEEWKLEEQKRLWEKYYGKKDQSSSKSSSKSSSSKSTKDKQVASLQHEAAHIAQHLRSENKEMRVQVEHMRGSGTELGRKNEDLQRANDMIYKNIEELNAAMPKLKSDNEKLMSITKAFEQKKRDFDATLKEGQEKWDMEQSIRSLYQLTAEEIVRMVGKSTREPNPMLIEMIKSAAARDFKAIEDAQQAQHEKIAKKFGKSVGKDGSLMVEEKQANEEEDVDNDDDEDDDDEEDEPAPAKPAPASPKSSRRSSSSAGNTSSSRSGRERSSRRESKSAPASPKKPTKSKAPKKKSKKSSEPKSPKRSKSKSRARRSSSTDTGSVDSD